MTQKIISVPLSQGDNAVAVACEKELQAGFAYVGTVHKGNTHLLLCFKKHQKDAEVIRSDVTSHHSPKGKKKK